MTQFEFQSSTYPNSQSFHRAIAESWLCAGGQNGREAMLEILAEASDEQLASDCASGWGMLDHADFDGDDMLDAFRELRANFDAHFPAELVTIYRVHYPLLTQDGHRDFTDEAEAEAFARERRESSSCYGTIHDWRRVEIEAVEIKA
jgi:hypothetical protein